MNWGSFAEGFSKTWNPKVIGGAINENLMTSGLEENEAAHKAALEDANYKEVDDTGAEINRYDDATRKKKIAEADKALKEANEKTVRKWKGAKGLQEWKSTQMQNEAAEMELNRAKKFQSTIDSWNSGEAFSDPQNIAMLNATKDWLSGYMPGAGLERGEIVLGANGQLQVKDGDKFNDITPGALQTIKGTGISMALAMQGDLEGFKTWNAMASKRFSAMDDDKRTGIYAATSDARPDHTRGMKNPFGSLSPEEQRLISDYRKKNRKEAIPTDGDQ